MKSVILLVNLNNIKALTTNPLMFDV